MRRALLAMFLAAGVVAVVVLASMSSHRDAERFVAPHGWGANPGTAGSLPTERFVSPHGSDRNPGTAGSPWRTLRKALSGAVPGDTVVLLPGTYGAYGRRTNWSVSGRPGSPITFEGERGPRKPTVLGYNKIEGSHLRILNLSFRGPTGPVDRRSTTDPTGQEVMVWIAGGDVELAGCDVVGSRWHAGIYVAGRGDVRIIANYVTDNGDFSDPAQANLDQGIYWGYGSGGLIADNVIAHNLADGIQLYPQASRIAVEQNTIVGNGKSGVIIANGSSGNVVANNIVEGNVENSIRSFDLTGSDNLVRNNLVWNNGSQNLGNDATGLTLTGNLQADPRFVSNGDYRPRADSPAIGRALRLPGMLLYDITGAHRTKHFDIGAYQAP